MLTYNQKIYFTSLFTVTKLEADGYCHIRTSSTKMVFTIAFSDNKLI